MAHRLIAQSFLQYPLSTILGDEGQIRVLRELSRHERELSVTKLSNQTALTRQEVKDILATLVASGAVSTVRVGRGMLFGMGDHPIMPAVREVLAAEERIYTSVMDRLRACVSAHQGVLAAWVYGSAARGEDRPGSDIDIVIVVDDTEVEAVTRKVRRSLVKGPSRLPGAPSIVGLGTSDVIRLSAGHPSWKGLAKDAMTLKGDAPYVYARRLQQIPPSTKAKTFGEALDEIGFVPLDPPRRITLRRGRHANRLTRWRKPKERG
jgi:hypothetical protein